MTDTKILLKDILFNASKVKKLASDIKNIYPEFADNNFCQEIVGQFPSLELKARITAISKGLKKYLPKDYKTAVQVMLQSLPPPNNPDLEDNDFGDFIHAPFAEFIAQYGCDEKNLHFSLEALKEITKRFSAEDAIRYFINAYPAITMAQLEKWAKDKNYHVRRLCSEGTRPKLPWSPKIDIPFVATLPILHQLFYDKTRYVTRSVANHVNDISKISPDAAIKLIKQWITSGKQTTKEMDYIVRHGLRGLIKNGDSQALALLGIKTNQQIKIKNFSVSKRVKMNGYVDFSFAVRGPKKSVLLIHYIIYFQQQKGGIKGKKIFMFKKIKIAEEIFYRFNKKHLLRGDMTTRKLYKGEHKLALQINGKIYGEKKFMLI